MTTVKNISQESLKFFVRFANIVFILGILISALIAIYAIYKIYNNPHELMKTNTFYLISILFSGFSAILFGLGLRLSNNLKLNFLVLFITIGISVFTFETYLMLAPEQKLSQPKQNIFENDLILSPRTKLSQLIKNIEKIGGTYDTRTKKEVIEDLNEAGVDAYPNVFPKNFLHSNGLNSNKGRIYPLGGISNIITILDNQNESGNYIIIEADEHGFNNPKGLYKKNKVDILLTGDSFTEGYSVQSDETISAVLRKSGFNTISIGKANNGPLIELAALKEYAEPLQPKIVLWLFFEDNDLIELFHEKSSSILRKYLYENDFSQNLLERQEEIDSVLINFVQEKLKEMKKKERKKKEETKENIRTISEQEIYKKILNKSNKIAFDWEWAIKMLKLSNIRSRINLVPAASESVIFKNILNKSKKIVSEWEGEMYFVYLPSYKQYSTSKKIKNRELILRTVTKLDIPIIDINTEVFNLHPDPLSLFPHRTDGLHYTVEGYHLIAKEIEKIIKADGINSTKLDN